MTDYSDILDSLERLTGNIPFITTDHETSQGRDAAFDRWQPRTRDAKYAYRTIFPNETVFDIGDCNDRECGLAGHKACWLLGRQHTILLWTRLELNGIPHWRALSGGKGFHTHVFVDEAEYRKPFWVWATVPRHIGDVRIIADGLLQSPQPGNRMVREFGALHPRTGWRKTLWARRPEDLPLERAESYRIQKLRLPSSWVSAGQPPGANFFEVRRSLGGVCPQSTDCHDATDFCDACPVNR